MNSGKARMAGSTCVTKFTPPILHGISTLNGYEERQAGGLQQRQLSKEFVREWLMANGFMGKEGQKVPEMSDEWINEISERYIELYEGITGEKFVKAENIDIPGRIESNILRFLNSGKQES